MATHSRGSGIKRVEVVWPEDFVDQIDKDRGSVSRSAWLRQAAGVKMGEKGRTVPIEVGKEALDLNVIKAVAEDQGKPEVVKTARQLLAERTELLRQGKKLGENR